MGYRNEPNSGSDPVSRSGIGTLSGAAPQIILTPSSIIRISPNVASTWSRWSRA